MINAQKWDIIINSKTAQDKCRKLLWACSEFRERQNQHCNLNRVHKIRRKCKMVCVPY